MYPIGSPISSGNLSPSPARSSSPASEARIRAIIAEGVIFVPNETLHYTSPVKGMMSVELTFPPADLICPNDQ